MSRLHKATGSVKGTAVKVLVHREQDYSSLTDIARHRNPEHTEDLARNWLRNRNAVEFLGIREALKDPDRNPVEFDGFRLRTGLNSFTLTPKQWAEGTRAIGINESAIRQMQVLTATPAVKQLKG